MAGNTSFVSATSAYDRFGNIALRCGFVTQTQLQEAVNDQKVAAKNGIRRKLGDILVHKGYLSYTRLFEILRNQTLDYKQIGDFIVSSKLGEGAMGAVYKAVQKSMRRDVALKILSGDLAKDLEFRERFLREARAVARLNHPHIVAGIDVGVERGVYFFAMEFIDGEDLGQRIRRRGFLREKEALRLIGQIAEALNHAHRHGILHRDVKPENIMIDMDGEAKLADLGLAAMANSRRFRAGNKFGSDAHGLAIGTPHYMSPEQAQGLDQLQPASDLYSLGATFFHLITGRYVFEGKSSSEIMLKHVMDRPPDPRQFNPAISAAAATLCLKLLNKEPRERFRSGLELARAIKQLESEPLALWADFTEHPGVKATRVKSARYQQGTARHTALRKTVSKVGKSVRKRKVGQTSGILMPVLLLLLVLSVLLLILFK